jgi:hypothetical protein
VLACFWPRKVGIGTGTGGVTPMTATNDFQSAVDKILTEIDELNEEIDLVPKIITEQLNYSEEFEFRSLTKKEKKEFVNSLNAKGKQILTELEGKPKRGLGRKLRVASDQTSVSDAERTMFAHFGKLDVA